MNQYKRLFGLLVLFSFVLIQGYASVTFKNIYPFSPYRMFSKLWAPGVVMDQVSYETWSDRSYRPFDILPIPFFLANHLSFITFLDPSSELRKTALCSLLLKASREYLLNVYADLVRFDRVDGDIKATVIEHKRVYACE